MILAKECRSSPHRPPGWSISGGSAASDDELRQQIRARLSEARLPPVNGVSRSSRGTGRLCIVCRRTIDPRPRSSAKSMASGCSCTPTTVATGCGGRNRLCSAPPGIEPKIHE